MDKKLVRQGFINALGTTAYVCLVVIGIANAERFLGSDETILIPMTMLMLFILSATITSSLVLGKPILMYLNGQKAEAVKLFLYTVGWLGLYTIIFIALNTIK